MNSLYPWLEPQLASSSRSLPPRMPRKRYSHGTEALGDRARAHRRRQSAPRPPLMAPWPCRRASSVCLDTTSCPQQSMRRWPGHGSPVHPCQPRRMAAALPVWSCTHSRSPTLAGGAAAAAASALRNLVSDNILHRIHRVLPFTSVLRRFQAFSRSGAHSGLDSTCQHMSVAAEPASRDSRQESRPTNIKIDSPQSRKPKKRCY